MNCKNCSTELSSNYCPNCGQSASLKRIDGRYIFNEIQHLLHFEKGVFFTVKHLFLKPGISIREYIKEDRNKLLKPITFLIITSLLYSLIGHFFNTQETFVQKEDSLFGKSHINDILSWRRGHFGYANIIQAIFISFAVRLIFRKHGYNLYETTTLMCFIIGQVMLYSTVELLFNPLISWHISITILSILAFIYPTWAIGQFYGSSKISNYIKALFAYLLGYYFFYVVIVLIGFIIDLLSKH